MGKLIIKYEHSNNEWYNTNEWEMDNTKAHELYNFFTDIVWKIMKWKGVK